LQGTKLEKNKEKYIKIEKEQSKVEGPNWM
jgi:hypothetical protein